LLSEALHKKSIDYGPITLGALGGSLKNTILLGICTKKFKVLSAFLLLTFKVTTWLPAVASAAIVKVASISFGVALFTTLNMLRALSKG
jgi:hypothetical protein